MKRILGTFAVLGLLAGLGGGCTSSEPAGSEGDALLVEEPVFLVPEWMWRMAPEGCEGRVDEDLFFVARAQNEPDLGVVLDGEGVPVCVDTWDSIRIELDRVKGDPSPDPMRPMGLDGRPRR